MGREKEEWEHEEEGENYRNRLLDFTLRLAVSFSIYLFFFSILVCDATNWEKIER